MHRKILVSISSIMVFSFATTAATFSHENMISIRRNAATSYSLTLDSTNKPTLIGGEGTKNIGYATFSYHNAANISNGHVSLYENGYIEKDMAKGLQSFVGDFTGDIAVLSGFSTNDYCYTYHPTRNEQIRINGNYIKIVAESASDIKSITLEYSCSVETVESHIYASEWNYDENYHWHDCTENNCSSKTNVQEHNFIVDEENSYPPSGGNDGLDVLTCTVCGAHYIKTYSYETVGAWNQQYLEETLAATKAKWTSSVYDTTNSWVFDSASEYRALDAKAAVQFIGVGGYLRFVTPKVDFTQYSKLYMRFSANGRNEADSDNKRMLTPVNGASGPTYGNVGKGTILTNYIDLEFSPNGTVSCSGNQFATLNSNQLNGTESFMADSIVSGAWPVPTTLYASDYFIKKYNDNTASIDQSPIDIDLSESTYTFDIPVEIDIESIYWNETYLGNTRTINTSAFGGVFGDGGNIYINYRKDKDVFVAPIPVTLCTKILKTPDDVRGFLTLADAVNGTLDDNIYDGHFILGNDVDFNNSDYPILMHNIPVGTGQSAYGFRGVFDGRGHSINNINILVPGWNESTDRVTGFISRLTKTGVLKNTAFVNITALWTTTIVGWGEGLCENIYVKYSPSNVTTAYFGAFNNGQSSRLNGMATVRNCLVDGSRVTKGSESILHLLGNQFEEMYAYQGVYCLLPDANFPLFRKCDRRESSISMLTSSSLSYDIANGYHGELLRECQTDILSWDYFHRDSSGLYFGETLITTETPNSLSTHNFPNDYLVVCDKDDIESVKAASLIVEHLYKATSTSVTYTKKDSNAPEFYRDYTGGTIIHKVGKVDYSSDKNLIVVGNKDIENQLSLSTNDSRFVKVDNSIILMCKDSKDYLATAIEFLNQVIGMTALNDNLTYYGSMPTTLPNIDFEFNVAFQSRNRPNYCADYNYNTFGFNGVATVHEFTNGPVDGNGNVVTFHNSIWWLPLDQYQSSHPNWYRTDGTVDVCYTAHGNSSEFNLMVEQTAINMRNALINKPNDTKLTFSLQDTDFNGCSCSACQSARSTYADNGAGSAINFLNKVAEKIVELDSQNGVNNREFTLYILGYFYLFKAPSNITLNEHVGVVIAPLSNSREAYSIYDSVNSDAKTSIEKWCSLTNNIAIWYYCITFYNYFSFIDVFESLLSWIEHIYTCTNGKVTFAYIQGASYNHQITGFQVFKQYIYSRAMIEIMNKVNPRSSYSSLDTYKTAIKNYLIELENEYFGITNRTSTTMTSSNFETVINGYTFSNNGAYGNSDSNKYMYQMYMDERYVYQDMLSRQVTTTNSDSGGKLWGRIFDRYDYLLAGSRESLTTSSKKNIGNDFFTDTSSSTKFYYCANYTTAILNKMMGYYENAISALSSYSHPAIAVYRQNVIIESLYPRFFICMANTTKSGYGYSNGYNGTTLATMRTNLKADCQSVGYQYYGEGTSISVVYTKWGI